MDRPYHSRERVGAGIARDHESEGTGVNITEIVFQYFNGIQNPYITATGDNLIPKFDRVITMSPGQHMHVGENEHGIVNFGLWYDNERKRPGHGGFWSSRESIVGPLIGKRLVAVAINRIAVSMTVESLEKLLPDEYHIEERETKNGKGTEVVYAVQRKDGSHQVTPYREIISGLMPSYRLG